MLICRASKTSSTRRPIFRSRTVIPSGLPGASVSNTAQINYFNYSINLVHHFTGLSWLNATTAAGFERDRRSLVNPVTVGYNLIAGVNAPTVGTVQNNFFYRTEQLDQSMYAQEQVITLATRLTVTAGVTAERSTNDGDINTFYYYPRYSASYGAFVPELPRRSQAPRGVRPVRQPRALRRTILAAQSTRSSAA